MISKQFFDRNKDIALLSEAFYESMKILFISLREKLHITGRL